MIIKEVGKMDSDSIEIYRFMSAKYGLEALQSGKFKVGRIRELNDPYDCTPHIEEDCFATPDPIELPHKDYGIISFSERCDDPVIWSHYAENHTGIALGFRFSKKRVNLYKMNYSDDRPCIKRSELINPTDEKLKELFKTPFCTKAQSWEYEQEYRFFIPFSQCTMTGEHYFLNIPRTETFHIILGEKCIFNDRDISNAKYQQFLGRDIKISRCQKSATSFKMTIVPVA